MRTCPKCGQPIASAAARFCANCGQPLISEQESPQQPAAAPMPDAADTAQFGASAPSLQPPAPPPGYPPYGQPAPPSGYPPYGQPAPPSGYPPYGQYAPPPAYGAPPTRPVTYSQPLPPASPYGPAYGAGGYPGAMLSDVPAKRRSPWRGIVGATLGVIALVAIVIGVIYGVSAAKPSSRADVGSATVSTPQPTTLLTDSLRSAHYNWTQDGSHCFFQSDGYHIVGGYLCFAPIGMQTDGTETVTAKQISGKTTEAYGLIFRHASRGNYYLFGVDSNSKWVFIRVVNGSGQRLQEFTANDAIKGGMNTKNALSVTMSGSTFDCYVNGVKVGTVHDSTFSEGAWGLEGAGETVFTDYLAVR